MGYMRDTILRLLRIVLDFVTWLYAFIFWPDQEGRISEVTDWILLKPAVELAELIKKQEVTAEQVMKSYIRRIREVNPLINAVIDERFSEALHEAKWVDRMIRKEDPSILDLPLLGVPFTCKDSIQIKGLQLVVGLRQRKGLKSEEDAKCVTNLRQAGAIPVAVGNVPEILTWWTSDNRVFGRTNNPYDLSRIAGGSSGGDAALIAAGGALVSVGSDCGGSVRIPSCMCGIFGHKTTNGVVSTHGRFPELPPAMDNYYSFGPMTRYAVDLKPMVKGMAGDDIKKLPKIDDPVEFSKMTIYYIMDDEDPLKNRTSKQIKESILKAVNHFKSSYQTEVREVRLPKMRWITQMFLASVLVTKGEPILKTINWGLDGDLNVYWTFLKAFFGFGPHTRHVALFALIVHFLPDPDSKWVKDGIKMREELASEMTSLLGENGVLIMPSYPDVPPKHGTTITKNPNISHYAVLNMLGLPATQVPVGLSPEGYPLGIQMTANKFNDHLTIGMAEELEKVFGGWMSPSPYIKYEAPKLD